MGKESDANEPQKVEKHRFTFNVNREERDAIKAAQARRGVTATAAIDRAVRIYAMIDSVVNQGCDIVTVDKDGTETRIIFLG